MSGRLVAVAHHHFESIFGCLLSVCCAVRRLGQHLKRGHEEGRSLPSLGEKKDRGSSYRTPSLRVRARRRDVDAGGYSSYLSVPCPHSQAAGR